MVGKREYQQPRVPFGHPGLEIRHPLRGLGGEGLDSMNIMPVAFQNRLQFITRLTVNQPHPTLPPEAGKPQAWGE